MKTTELLASLKNQGFEFWLEEDRLRYRGPQGVLTTTLRKTLAERKPELRSLLLRDDFGSSSTSSPLQPVPRDGQLPLSSAQLRLWLLDQMEPQSPAYNIPLAVQITGSLQLPALEKCFEEILRRHEVFRMRCLTQEGQPYLVIDHAQAFKIVLQDLRELPKEARTLEVDRLASLEAKNPFDLATGPFLRVTCFQLDKDEYVLLIVTHHFVADGWSMNIFYREISTLYNAFVHDQPSPLPDLPLQYVDITQWERNRLNEKAFQDQLTFWKRVMADAPKVLNLPTDHPRPATQSYRGAFTTFSLSSGLSESLRNLSRQESVTLFMTLLAAFQVLLFRYTHEKDIVVGTAVSIRSCKEAEGLMGSFWNAVLLRTHCEGSATFRELLEQVREVAIEAYAHQDLPFEKLLQSIAPKRTLDHHPLFQVMFVLFEHSGIQALQLDNLQLSTFPIQTHTARLDLSLAIRISGKQLLGALEYSTDLFDEISMKRMMAHFENLLEAIIANPDQPIATLPLLSDAERHCILYDRNASPATVSSASHQLVHHLIEDQAERTPEAVAVVFEQQRLTYRELNARANQVARALQAQGVEPETLVGICLERGLDMVVGLLGILKAGGAYVPIDPSYPKDRLDFMLKDTQMLMLITHSDIAATLPDHNRPVLCLDRDWPRIAQQPDTNLFSRTSPEHLAYVIYTSGSTGLPKGVMIPHGALVNYVQTARQDFAIGSADRVLQFASISFDASAEEIYPCLTSGGTLVLRAERMLDSWNAFLEKCQEEQLTILDLPTAFWHELVTGMDAEGLTLPRSVRLVIIGGDRARPERLAQWHNLVSESVQLVNTYGPTEATIVATKGELVRPPSSVLEKSEVTLGKVIPNVRGYVLDRAGHPAPIGVTGELFLGGRGVARGYVNQADTTAEKFVPDPFSQDPGARLYRTGDLVRYRNDGTLQFIGRADHQVKLRGFRIELGEIEAVLERHPAVLRGVVVAREDERGEKRLVAYVVATDEPSVSELRSFLQKRLPEYMIPSGFVLGEELPLLPNGKVDRRALPAPDQGYADLDTDYVPPRGPIEETLVTIWQEVLETDQVGVFDNFFDLGGHSLSSMQVIAKVEQQLGVRLEFRDLLFQTLGQVAGECTERLSQGSPP